MVKHNKTLMIFAAAALWLLWFYIITSAFSTPQVAFLRWLPPPETAFMGIDGRDGIKYKWVPISKISPNLSQAVVAAEDDQFFTHRGFDIEAIKKAAKIDWRRRRFSRGASTITMQLARNLYLSPQKSISRKLKELFIAMKLERELTKERILELYLNVAEWGDGIYGAEAAARHYFGKSASDLDRREAAFLAAILPRPKFYDRNRGGPGLIKRIDSIGGRI